jgi:hypothetical protein
VKKYGCAFTTGTPRKPGWNDIAARFSTDRDCLAAFVALQAAEVLAGAKPSNLVSMVKKRPPCGRDFRALWKEHGPGLIVESSLEARELIDRGNSLLLLLYDRGSLKRLLSRRNVVILLRRAGYPRDIDVESVLDELQIRLSSGKFPHEIGILLGYPLKDVVGFMGWARLRFSFQGPWKIYGNPRQSLLLAETHLRCRYHMSLQLVTGADPYQRLRTRQADPGFANTPERAFFCNSIENDFHF